MSYQTPIEDTQPKSPLKGRMPPPQSQQPPLIDPTIPPPDQGPGCFMWGCIGTVGMMFAVVIVLLAGAAGWTSGQRQASAYATATQNGRISAQVERIPADIANGNLQLADLRLRFLAVQTPGVPGIPELAQTATTVYLTRQPTPTPTATVTSTPAPESTASPTDDLVITPVDDGGGYDLPALLAEAQQDIASGLFADAYELLNVIDAVDPSFQSALVRDLTGQSLNGQARFLFNSNKPAEAIIWATRAEDLGVLQGDLSYELFAAQNYLTAKSAVGINYPQAIASLSRLYNLGEGRYYAEAQQLLVDQYIAYGDLIALDINQGNCAAVAQYQNAVNIQPGNGFAISKRDTASTLCSQGTPSFVITPGAEGTLVSPFTPDPNFAPIGQR